MTWNKFWYEILQLIIGAFVEASKVVPPDEEKDITSTGEGSNVSEAIHRPQKRWYMNVGMVKMLAHIRSIEAGKAQYNADFRNDDKWILTDKTFDQVRELGRSQVRQGEPSSAIGGYQFLTATLDSLKKSLNLRGDELFNAELQDDLAVALMIRRGYLKWLRGEISDNTFANNLAKEWASFPVVVDMQGSKRWLVAGQSYYAGDGLNKALTKPSEVLALLKLMKTNAAISHAKKSV